MSNFWGRLKPSKPPPAVVKIEVAKDHLSVQFAWEDGLVTRATARALRQNCPCAACVDEWTNKRTLDPNSVPDGLTLTEVAPVGSYALSFNFSDHHNTGIFNWPHLRELSSPP